MINEVEQNQQAFVNRYGIALERKINQVGVDQLCYELGAVNPILAKSVNGVLYLTADKFTNLSFLIQKARTSGSFDSYTVNGVDSELIHIDHWFFDTVYFEFPKRLLQAKRLINNLPFYLGDCLVVNQTDYTSNQGNKFVIYRIEVNMTDLDETKFLDLITDANNNFLAIGSNVSAVDRLFHTSGLICESLSISIWMKESF